MSDGTNEGTSDAQIRARALLAAATPGPWASDGLRVFVPVSTKRIPVAAMEVDENCIGIDLDNAVLVAAAPELIERLCDELDAAHASTRQAQAAAHAMLAAVGRPFPGGARHGQWRCCETGHTGEHVKGCPSVDALVVNAGHRLLDDVQDLAALRAEVASHAEALAAKDRACLDALQVCADRIRALEKQLAGARVEVACDACCGIGYISDGHGGRKKCGACNGTGETSSEP